MSAAGAFEWKTAEGRLVREATGGSRAAFGALYQHYRRMVHGILLAHVSYTEAEDLLQDVFLQAMQKLPRLREEAAFGSWLAAISRNAALDYRRASRPAIEMTEGNAGVVVPDDAAFVLNAIRALPEAYSETLMLRLAEGMTGPEIAARTGLTPDSVRVNLCRGMKLLRERLEGRNA